MDNMKPLQIIIIALFLGSCFQGTDPEINMKSIQKDFWLSNSVSDYNYSLIWNTDNEPNGGIVIVSEKIESIESNSNFIIASQFPEYKTSVNSDSLTFYIIDLRKYDHSHKNTFHIHKFSDKTSFLNKKKEWSIDLNFE